MKMQYITDCALLMMVCLADENRIITSRELESKIRFPQQSIFTASRKLKKAGFINTVSGPFGGYLLAKPPEQITVQEILSAFKDAFTISNEALAKKSSMKSLRKLAKKLSHVKDEIDAQMSFTLADVLNAPD